MRPEVVDFDYVVAEHRPHLVRFAYSLLHDSGLAEDVAQETLLAAYQNRHVYTGTGSLRGWLVDIAWQRALDIFRREQSLETMSLQSQRDEEIVARATEPCHARLKAAALRALDEKVLPSQAKVVRMRYLEELSPDSIAARLGVSRSTVVSRLHRGIVSLRFYVEEARGAAYARVARLDASLGHIGMDAAAIADGLIREKRKGRP